MNLYSIFHLNTSFSSIEKTQIPEIIDRCYWPLLNLIENQNIQISIEATASTLLDIKKFDIKWIKKFNELLKKKKCEFIGSGYKQIIGPLVPYKINNYNLKRGNEVYKNLLISKPNICFVNEQAFSHSMKDLYSNNGYNTIVIDWNNFSKTNPKANDKLQYKVCNIYSSKKKPINIIWNNSLNFQKFQRYIYNEVNLNHFYNSIRNLNTKSNIKMNYSFYGSDAEIFNYRPGRFSYEILKNQNEWKKIENLYLWISKKKNIKFVLLSDILNKKVRSNHLAYLTNSQNPIIVKKQSKYNITRWALTGWDDFKLNTFCWKYYNKIKNSKQRKKWDILCDLWSSDYRTHLTKKKWVIIKRKIKGILKKDLSKKINAQNKKISNKYFFLKNKKIEIKLNSQKGFHIEGFTDNRFSKKSLFGWTPQGYLNSIDNDVDYFSGHFTYEYNNKKFTDLNNIIKKILYFKNQIILDENDRDFKYRKSISLKNNKLNMKLSINNFKPGILRLFYITINSENFNLKKLFYACKNGGSKIEKFFLKNSINFNHGDKVSNSVSSNMCLGATDNKFYIGDDKKIIRIEINRSLGSIYPMIQFFKTKKKYLLRVYFSACEIDETTKIQNRSLEAEINVSAIKNMII